jgi:alpha-galactosidase
MALGAVIGVYLSVLLVSGLSAAAEEPAPAPILSLPLAGSIQDAGKRFQADVKDAQWKPITDPDIFAEDATVGQGYNLAKNRILQLTNLKLGPLHEYTLTCLFKPTTLDNTTWEIVRLVERKGGKVMGVLKTGSDGKVTVNYQTAADDKHHVMVGTTRMTVNNWYCLALTVKEGDKVRLYVNGILEAEAPLATLPENDGAYNLLIGMNTAWSAVGMMADVRLYDKCLDATQLPRVAKVTPAANTSTDVRTVTLIELGLKSALTFAYEVRPGKTVGNKTPSLGGTPMPDAFGMVGNCILNYDLKGKAERLSGVIGVDDSVDKAITESIEVQVYGDNKRLWSSGPMKAGDKPIPLDVDVKGVKRLELFQDFSGNQFMKVQVAWAHMALTYTGTAPVAVFPRPTPFAGKPFITPAGPETPRITGARVFGVRPGSPFLFTVTASGRKPMTFSAKNLPQELHLNADTGQITGCLRTKGEYRVALTARNELGTSERELRIVVGDNISLTPAMGWSTWNAYLKQIDQLKVQKAAEFLVSTGLKDHGYLYVNIDDGWQGTRGGKDNALQPNDQFPDMKGLCDTIHRLGLKAGIYHTPWMSSYGRFCGGTAATPDGKWDPEHPVFAVGPCSFLNQDAKQWAEWEIDYCKWDWILDSPDRAKDIMAVSDALKQSGRDMVCALSNRAVIELGPTFVAQANSWRITNDFLPHWTYLANIAFCGDRWSQYAGPGHWPDMDMLVCGVAWGRKVELTPDEQYLEMSMWCLMSSPLLISCELDKLDEFTLRLLTNDEVLDINQDPLGKPARRTLTRGPLEVWVRELEDGSKAIGFVNRGREPLEETVDLKALGLNGKYQVRDLWKRADVGTVEGKITVSPAPHGVQLYRFTPTK